MRLQKQTPGQSPANFFSFPSTICPFPVILPQRPICFGLLNRKQVRFQDLRHGDSCVPSIRSANN